MGLRGPAKGTKYGPRGLRFSGVRIENDRQLAQAQRANDRIDALIADLESESVFPFCALKPDQRARVKTHLIASQDAIIAGIQAYYQRGTGS